MHRIKQKERIKEPVKIRTKSLVNGNKSLYLDTYDKGKRTYEFLRLYLIPERTAADRALNAATMKAANAIKASRTLAFINGKADIRTPDCKLSLKEWIGRLVREKIEYRAKSSIALMNRLVKHLEKFRPSILLTDVDRDFCIGFVDYLRTAQSLISHKQLMQATQTELFNALSIVLNEAVRAEFISRNPTRLLNASERIKRPESTREYLTPEEVKAIIEVAADNIAVGDDVAAFLFCCFCGLRYSDIVALKWQNIIETSAGKEIDITMKKTHRPISIPLSQQAFSLLPDKGNPEDNVFTFPHYSVTLKRLRKAAINAGIKKKVTFHVSRHTFATMMLTAGADLYTISKLIGHSDVRTTQIYSKVVDKKKQEAVALLDSLF